MLILRKQTFFYNITLSIILYCVARPSKTIINLLFFYSISKQTETNTASFQMY